jgi:hypothetical protein
MQLKGNYLSYSLLYTSKWMTLFFFAHSLTQATVVLFIIFIIYFHFSSSSFAWLGDQHLCLEVQYMYALKWQKFNGEKKKLGQCSLRSVNTSMATTVSSAQHFTRRQPLS